MAQDYPQTRPVDPHSEEFSRWAKEHAAGPNADAKLPPPVRPTAEQATAHGKDEP